MKQLIWISIVCFFLIKPILSRAQETAMPIALAYLTTDLPTDLGDENINRLTTKLVQIIDNYGFISAGTSSGFGLYPRFDILQDSEISGMRKMVAVKAELTLHVKQLSNGVVMGSMVQSINGSGLNRLQAVRNAINSLPSSGKKYEDFLNGVKTKLNLYYAENCKSIISQADSYVRTKAYAQAIGELLKIPVQVPTCHEQAQTKLSSYFKLFQQQYCAELVQAAKSRIAAGDYNSALDVLAVVDPMSPCGAEAKGLFPKIEGKVENQRLERLAWLKKIHTDRIELEKYRIEAFKEIGKAYYTALAQPDHWAHIIIVN